MTTVLRFHVASAVLGALGLGIVLLAASAASPGLPPRPIEVAGIPVPKDMVQIKSGTPYVVPTGKVFVLTGLGGTTYASVIIELTVNGQSEVITNPSSSSLNGLPSVQSVPAGFTAPGGSTVEVGPSGGLGPPGRAWGYLADD